MLIDEPVVAASVLVTSGKEDTHLLLSSYLQHYITYIGPLFTAAQIYDVEMAS